MNSTMASNLLPQALCTIPRNPTQCNHKKLGFSASLAIPHRPSPLNSAQFPISRVFLNDLTLTSLVSKFSCPSFVVRAEPNADVGEPGSSDVIEEESEVAVEAAAVETEAEVQAENKPPPKRPRVKLGDIMGILNKKAIEASDQERKTPDIRTGDVVEIKMEVPENRRRLSVYKGIVMSKQNAGIHTTIRVRRIVAGIGVEIVFPVYSPNIKEIKVVSHRKVRRARLYYLREKLPRLSTFK